MAQLHSSEEVRTLWTRSQLELNAWSQMDWFVTLGGAHNFVTMPVWERLKWKEEFAAMLLRTDGSVIPIPADPMRYPRGKVTDLLKVTSLPTIEQMQDVRDEITGHLTELADGKGTSLGPFKVTFLVMFRHVHDAYGTHETPRHFIQIGETGEPKANIYQTSLLRHMTRLLETYCDQIRRCPHCSKVFLQNRRHQEYCRRSCQSVAVMQKRRNKEKMKGNRPIDKKPALKASIKGGLQHDKKAR